MSTAPLCQGTTIDGTSCAHRTWRENRWCGRCAYPPGAAPESAQDTRNRFRASLTYRDPASLRRALDDRARARAKQDPRFNSDQIRRQFAYNRLLARTFAHDPDRWCLKGGVALLARLPDARHSADIDLASDRDPEELVQALREAAQVDLDDYFTFQVLDNSTTEMVGEDRDGVRVNVVPRIGGQLWGANKGGFGIDIVAATRLPTSTSDEIEAWDPINAPGMQSPRWRVYPIADHLADKVLATVQTYGKSQQSSRARDGVDILLIARSESVDGDAAVTATRSEFVRRKITKTPETFTFPTSAAWANQWNTSTSASPAVKGLSMADAQREAALFVDPILTGQARGHRWDPTSRSWVAK